MTGQHPHTRDDMGTQSTDTAGQQLTPSLKMAWDLRGVYRNVSLIQDILPVILRSLLSHEQPYETFQCLQKLIGKIANMLKPDHSNPATALNNKIFREFELDFYTLKDRISEASDICRYLKPFVSSKDDLPLDSNMFEELGFDTSRRFPKLNRIRMRRIKNTHLIKKR